MKKTFIFFSLLSFGIIISSCDRGDLSINPNAAGSNAILNPDLFVNRLTVELYNGGGVVDKYANAQPEGPWTQVHRWNQYYVSNYSYYWGSNFYNWTNTANHFSMLKYATLMEQQVTKQGAANINQKAYLAVVKFFKAYSFIWYTQRVGDCPMTKAGNPDNLTPAFDTQHDIYKNCLALLDTANTLMGNYITQYSAGGKPFSSGDVYGLTNLQWQKVINSYKLRVLISLSKRADDTPDLNIKGQFATILGNPTLYPIMTGNSDNVVYKFNAAFNPYPIKANGNLPYSQFENASSTFLNLTTPVADPRTFIAATPAPALIAGGKLPGDFTAYVGADPNIAQGTLNSASANGTLSFSSYKYYASADGSTCEPAIIIGYPELCFNVAEGINRGWASGNDGQWYLNGINASLSFYSNYYSGFKDGGTFAITDKAGVALGNATISFANFLNNVAYAGNNSAAGLTQILQQKYVAMWQNSGWEPYYNWRRTGVPAFSQGGAGIGTANSQIQRRWLYDNNEITANPTNYNSAIQSQYGGSDDVTKDIWAIK